MQSTKHTIEGNAFTMLHVARKPKRFIATKVAKKVFCGFHPTYQLNIHGAALLICVQISPYSEENLSAHCVRGYRRDVGRGAYQDDWILQSYVCSCRLPAHKP